MTTVYEDQDADDDNGESRIEETPSEVLMDLHRLKVGVGGIEKKISDLSKLTSSMSQELPDILDKLVRENLSEEIVEQADRLILELQDLRKAVEARPRAMAMDVAAPAAAAPPPPPPALKKGVSPGWRWAAMGLGVVLALQMMTAGGPPRSSDGNSWAWVGRIWSDNDAQLRDCITQALGSGQPVRCAVSVRP